MREVLLRDESLLRFFIAKALRVLAEAARRFASKQRTRGRQPLRLVAYAPSSELAKITVAAGELASRKDGMQTAYQFAKGWAAQ